MEKKILISVVVLFYEDRPFYNKMLLVSILYGYTNFDGPVGRSFIGKFPLTFVLSLQISFPSFLLHRPLTNF